MPSKGKAAAELENPGSRLQLLEDGDQELEATLSTKRKRKSKKKRSMSEVDVASTGDALDAVRTSTTSPPFRSFETGAFKDHGENMNGVLAEADMNDPTMGEKLAVLNLQDNRMNESNEKEEMHQQLKPPSADSVNVLLRQALRADDRTLLLECLYTQDEKVIANSVSVLSSSDVLKLLQSLIAIIQSRGAILACALPWLRSLLLQHASGVMSQESSLLALNSLYQLIEARLATFQSTLQLSSCLDLLYVGVADEASEDVETITPIIYQDETDEEESDGSIETDHENSDNEGGEGMEE